MYPLAFTHSEDPDLLTRVIRDYPLATVISPHPQRPVVTHLPLLYVPQTSGLGLLVGHMDRNNPQQEALDEQPIQAIFHGPNTYISPHTYVSDQLPTWNYVKVHVYGTVHRMDSLDEVRDLMVQTTAYLEQDRPKPYALPLDHKTMNALLPHVSAFRITIEEWAGKFKLSQDKKEADLSAARDQLLDDTRHDAQTLIDTLLAAKKN